MSKQTNQHFNKSTLQLSKPKRVRLITICGSIQLVSAIAAIRTKEANDNSYKESHENILLIYSLNQDSPKRTRLFLELLKDIAEELISVTRIIHFSSELLHELNDKKKINFLKLVTFPKKPLFTLISSKNIDEIWVNSDFNQEVKLLCSYFSESRVIAYGDGPGIYFTEKCRFIFPRQKDTSGRTSFRTQVRIVLKPILIKVYNHLITKNFLFSNDNFLLNPVQFNDGFFLFPDTFEKPPDGFNYAKIDTDTFIDIFWGIKPKFDYSFLNDLFDGKSIIPITILLTANLSEAKRMKELDEIQAYENLLVQHTSFNDLVLIKPHPRDSRQKLLNLKQRLRQTFQQVEVMEEEKSQYIPFELYILHLISILYKDWETFTKMVNIITISTSCLTLAELFGIKCKIGLAEKDIYQYFRSDQVRNRIDHNRILQQIVDRSLETHTPFFLSKKATN